VCDWLGQRQNDAGRVPGYRGLEYSKARTRIRAFITRVLSLSLSLALPFFLFFIISLSESLGALS